MKKKLIFSAVLLSGGLSVGLQPVWSQSMPSTGEHPRATFQGKDSIGGVRGERQETRGIMESSRLSEYDIRRVEQGLQEKGFDPGNVDGVLDQQTSAAIRAFQRANNLQETGSIDTVTADYLGITLQSESGDANRAE